MKKFLYITLAAAIALISCNKSEFDGGERVTLDYEVAMPGVATKAATIGDGSHVDQVVCAVFENGAEIPALRKTFSRNPDGTFPNYQPSLYLGREYQIVFWAHRAGKYDVTKMDDITYGTNGYATNDENMDAFTLTQTVKINKDKTVTVGKGANVQTMPMGQMAATLKRPFAKLNVGTVASDWTSDVTVTHSRITLSIVQTHFDAVAGEVVEEKFLADQKYHAAIPAQTFEVDGTVYKYVSLNYLFPGSLAEVTIELATKDFGAADFNSATDVIYEVTKENVPVNGNQQTNMIGSVLKGDLNFSVTVDGTFGSSDNDTNTGF
ncbi:MAG: hypothetical protein IJ971_01120 [Bacteroidales bacterium]|nr:hypothetical protein [Bacteroidales bacterium]